ncbi:interleukin-22 [Hemicordylus capensis]|uniref:interleukin-22 n=1 Tax=Hemicordylus capensis TaxID=884348 RepID=UPI0023035F0B|nr:interleukin-22 [Hemicordylus capensis]
MAPPQNWMRCSLLWVFCCCSLPLLFLGSPLPLKEANTPANHTCKLQKSNFQRPYIRNCTYTLAKLARLSDMDTDNRFIGQHLFNNVKMNDRCYLMKRVTDIVVSGVLSKLNNQYPNIQEVTNFLAYLNMELNSCKPLGLNEEHIESNLKEMKDKLIKLGENGKNKAVGELDLLFDYLENACTEAPKKMSTSRKGHNKN